MALVDPYSACPCGSGQKYKWCCQKVEPYLERAQRLLDGGQYESALKPLDEGLAHDRDNSSLLFRKGLVHLHLNQVDQARHALRVLLQKQPGHLGAAILSTRLALETEGAVAAIAQFQQAISAQRPETRAQLGSLASFLGSALAQAGFPAAGLAHLELAGQLTDGESKQPNPGLRTLKTDAGISLWEKNPYRLSPAPENASEPFRESFARALEWAGEGLWSAAAAAFELLAAGSKAGALADRNRGLCCLWLADHDGAVKALRRYISRTGPSNEAVDLESLCQLIDEATPGDLVEFVQLTWPIRNRDGLLSVLRADRFFAAATDRHLVPDDPDSPEVPRFSILDRASKTASDDLRREDIPWVEAELLVAENTVVLEAYDDGRLDRISDRFTAVAGNNIPPAHPRTKVIGHESRHAVALNWRWQFPAGITDAQAERLGREQAAYLIGELWPKTPHPLFRGRTPLEAAQAGDAEIALRAAVHQLSAPQESKDELIDWSQFRSKLRLAPETALDPERVDIEAMHLSRLSMLPVERLDEDRLLALYHRSREWGLRALTNRVARVIDQNPSVLTKGELDVVTLYGELAIEAADHGDRDQTASWIARGRATAPPQQRSAHALGWELVELQVEMMLEGPETWVPRLAVILERYRSDRDATTAVLFRLVSLGLIQARTDPERPDQLMLDTQILESYLSQYGPRVTTASGELGASAARGGIWTPESGAGAGASPIWTPGSDSHGSRAAEKPKIILPG